MGMQCDQGRLQPCLSISVIRSQASWAGVWGEAGHGEGNRGHPVEVKGQGPWDSLLGSAALWDHLQRVKGQGHLQSGVLGITSAGSVRYACPGRA